MAGIAPDGLALCGWLALVVAGAVARLRFRSFVRSQEDSGSLGRELAKVEERHGVMTVLSLRIEGLGILLSEEPRYAAAALNKLAAPLSAIAKLYHAEIERPTPRGFRLYLGRYLPNPDHRASALDLALALRERLAGELEDWGLGDPSIGVATAPVLASPLTLGDRVEVLASGMGVELADQLAEVAAPGAVRVDAVRGYSDQTFLFEEAELGRTLLDRASPELSAGSLPGGPESEPNRTADAPSSPG